MSEGGHASPLSQRSGSTSTLREKTLSPAPPRRSASFRATDKASGDKEKGTAERAASKKPQQEPPTGAKPPPTPSHQHSAPPPAVVHVAAPTSPAVIPSAAAASGPSRRRSASHSLPTQQQQQQPLHHHAHQQQQHANAANPLLLSHIVTTDGLDRTLTKAIAATTPLMGHAASPAAAQHAPAASPTPIVVASAHAPPVAEARRHVATGAAVDALVSAASNGSFAGRPLFVSPSAAATPTLGHAAAPLPLPPKPSTQIPVPIPAGRSPAAAQGYGATHTSAAGAGVGLPPMPPSPATRAYHPSSTSAAASERQSLLSGQQQHPQAISSPPMPLQQQQQSSKAKRYNAAGYTSNGSFFIDDEEEEMGDPTAREDLIGGGAGLSELHGRLHSAGSGAGAMGRAGGIGLGAMRGIRQMSGYFSETSSSRRSSDEDGYDDYYDGEEEEFEEEEEEEEEAYDEAEEEAYMHSVLGGGRRVERGGRDKGFFGFGRAHRQPKGQSHQQRAYSSSQQGHTSAVDIGLSSGYGTVNTADDGGAAFATGATPSANANNAKSSLLSRLVPSFSLPLPFGWWGSRRKTSCGKKGDDGAEAAAVVAGRLVSSVFTRDGDLHVTAVGIGGGGSGKGGSNGTPKVPWGREWYYTIIGASWPRLMLGCLAGWLLIGAGLTALYLLASSYCGAKTSIALAIYFNTVSLAANGGYVGEDSKMLDPSGPRGGGGGSGGGGHMPFGGGPRCFELRTAIVVLASYLNIICVGFIAAVTVAKAAAPASMRHRIVFSDVIVAREIVSHTAANPIAPPTPTSASTGKTRSGPSAPPSGRASRSGSTVGARRAASPPTAAAGSPTLPPLSGGGERSASFQAAVPPSPRVGGCGGNLRRTASTSSRRGGAAAKREVEQLPARRYPHCVVAARAFGDLQVRDRIAAEGAVAEYEQLSAKKTAANTPFSPSTNGNSPTTPSLTFLLQLRVGNMCQQADRAVLGGELRLFLVVLEVVDMRRRSVRSRAYDLPWACLEEDHAPEGADGVNDSSDDHCTEWGCDHRSHRPKGRPIDNEHTHSLLGRISPRDMVASKALRLWFPAHACVALSRDCASRPVRLLYNLLLRHSRQGRHGPAPATSAASADAPQTFPYASDAAFEAIFDFQIVAEYTAQDARSGGAQFVARRAYGPTDVLRKFRFSDTCAYLSEATWSAAAGRGPLPSASTPSIEVDFSKFNLVEPDSF